MVINDFVNGRPHMILDLVWRLSHLASFSSYEWSGGTIVDESGFLQATVATWDQVSIWVIWQVVGPGLTIVSPGLTDGR